MKPESIFAHQYVPEEVTVQSLYRVQEDQRAMEERFDKRGLAGLTEMVTDCAPQMITVPADYPDLVDFVTAREAPAIDFGLVQNLQPWHLPRGKEIYLPPRATNGFALYGGWGDVKRGPDGCFYFAIGNHLFYGGNAYIIQYDPVKKQQRVALDLRKVIGWGDGDWADGKVHGEIDIDPQGDMRILTFSGPKPRGDDWLDTPYRGGHLVRFNVLTGERENLGVPLEGATYKMFVYDWLHHFVFGCDQGRGAVMAYDVAERRLLYGGAPLNGINWFYLAALPDRLTGRVYSTDSITDEFGMPVNRHHHFVYWQRRGNNFVRLRAETPVNPVVGLSSALHSYTKNRDSNGAFWCMDHFGTIFTFYPDADATEYIGINWGRAGKATFSQKLSPGERYLYYAPGCHAEMYRYGLPIVQFDTRTRQKKVIAFLEDFYLEKYGYAPYGVYGLELDEKGESLLLYTNGIFSSKELGAGYGRPAIFHMRIPPAERAE